jgi:hypothetical protein
MSKLKKAWERTDQLAVDTDSRLPAKAGPVPDRLTIWPVDDGRYGLDATFQGTSGFDRAERHVAELRGRGVPHMFADYLGHLRLPSFGGGVCCQ